MTKVTEKVEQEEPRKLVVITEKKLKVGTTICYEGETVSFPVEEADKYISLGWCRCAETGVTGDRIPGSVRLESVINRVVPAAQ